LKKLIPTQRTMSATVADKFNRLSPTKTTAPDGTKVAVPRENPKITGNPAVQAAVKDGKAVTKNIKRIGGLRLAETARRGLTKVSGPVSLAAGAAEAGWEIAHGAKPGEAIGKAAGGIAVSGAASALATAGVAALVPGAGWAVAGGIVASVAASYAWDKLGGSKLAAKAGGWVQDRAVDGAKAVASGAKKAGSAIADGAKKVGSAVKHFFHF
jgi:hypothetical protein